MAVRYSILDTLTQTHELSKELKEFVDKGMAEVERTGSSISVKGNRTVSIERTQTATVKPKLKALSATTSGAGFNYGMVYFNIINLGYALKTLESKCSHEAAVNFASALLGVISSIVAAAMSTRTAYAAVMAKLGYRIPGLAFSVAIKNIVQSKLYSRVAGGPAIFIGLAADILKGARLGQSGNKTAEYFTYAGGVSIALGSGTILGRKALAVALLRTMAVAGASATVPVAGWIGAAVILAGTALVIGGVWLHSKAAAELHSPMELWAARSQFGNRQNDGERRDDLELDKDRKLPRYVDLESEMKAWYQASFAPVALDSDQARSLGLNGMGSGWQDNWFSEDEIEFVILLPGFILGLSTWEGSFGSVESRSGRAQRAGFEFPLLTVFGVDPKCLVTSAGLVLNYKITSAGFSNMSLAVEYRPNQGLDETAVAEATFSLTD